MSDLQIALDLSRKGYYVHPLAPGDKIPIAEHGSNDAARDDETIRAWWDKWPDANVGFGLNKTGLVDISSDCQEWAERFTNNGMLPTTRYTSGNGEHALYRLPPGAPIRACLDCAG
jgi:Bifunctional DNA primase/polymerase, N-terminal